MLTVQMSGGLRFFRFPLNDKRIAEPQSLMCVDSQRVGPCEINEHLKLNAHFSCQKQNSKRSPETIVQTARNHNLACLAHPSLYLAAPVRAMGKFELCWLTMLGLALRTKTRVREASFMDCSGNPKMYAHALAKPCFASIGRQIYGLDSAITFFNRMRQRKIAAKDGPARACRFSIALPLRRPISGAAVISAQFSAAARSYVQGFKFKSHTRRMCLTFPI